MKIIFLDIDGVMSTRQCWGKGMNNKWNAYKFDEKCVTVLNFILKETGAEIILSSDWRLHYTLHEMIEIFSHNGIIKGPIGFTQLHHSLPHELENARIIEIKQWLKQNAWKEDISWVAIDDIDMSEKFDIEGKLWVNGLSNFVMCSRQNEGIKQVGIKEKILEFLK